MEYSSLILVISNLISSELNFSQDNQSNWSFLNHPDSLCSSTSGSKSANVLAVLGGVAADTLDLTGFYYSGKAPVSKRKSQATLITATPA